MSPSLSISKIEVISEPIEKLKELKEIEPGVDVLMCIFPLLLLIKSVRPSPLISPDANSLEPSFVKISNPTEKESPAEVDVLR